MERASAMSALKVAMRRKERGVSAALMQKGRNKTQSLSLIGPSVFSPVQG